jgi:hypothetical protein
MTALAALLIVTACATNTREPDAETTGVGEAADSAVRQTGDGLTDAALSPLEDFNLRRENIPERLAGLDTPYGLPDDRPPDCALIAEAVAHLTSVLGEDDDLPAPDDDDEDEDTAQWAADKSSDSALNAVASEARGFIPFRGLVRDATGASAHARRVVRAYRLGGERRAYLKGYGQALGCNWPAAPLRQINGPDQRIEFRGDKPD